MTTSRAARLRLLALVLGLLVGGALAWLFLGGELTSVRSFIASTGAWGPLVYVVLHVLLTLVPVSKDLLAAVAGALFGLGWGITLSWVASMLSAVVTVVIARRVGREAVAQMTGPRVARVEDVLRRQGLLAVVAARVTPVVPFTVVNYGAGVSAVSMRDFVVGTGAGILPGTVGYAALGASAGQDSTTFVVAGAVGVLLLVGSVLLGRHLAGRDAGG